MILDDLHDYLVNDIACCTCKRSTQTPADGSCKHCQMVAFVHELRRPTDKDSVLDWTIRELAAQFGWASGTLGKAGIAYVVATGEDAVKLSNYIKRTRS